MTDNCVQCWATNHQKIRAVVTFREDPLCPLHAKEAGWEEPRVLAVVRCWCGKPQRHKGRHLSQGGADKAKQDQAATALADASILKGATEPVSVTINVTEVVLDRFWAKLSVNEKARIVEGLL